jgi:hypothetical protein
MLLLQPKRIAIGKRDDVLEAVYTNTAIACYTCTTMLATVQLVQGPVSPPTAAHTQPRAAVLPIPTPVPVSAANAATAASATTASVPPPLLLLLTQR